MCPYFMQLWNSRTEQSVLLQKRQWEQPLTDRNFTQMIKGLLNVQLMVTWPSLSHSEAGPHLCFSLLWELGLQSFSGLPRFPTWPWRACPTLHDHAPLLLFKLKANAHPRPPATEAAFSQLCARLLVNDISNVKRILIHLPEKFFKVTMLVACVSCALNISEFCRMSNLEESTFSPFRLPNSMDDF